MRPVTISQTSTGASDAIGLDYISAPFNVGVQTVVSGTVNYNVQFTSDDIYSSTYSSATGNWYNNISTMSGATTSLMSNTEIPVRGARVLKNSGTGSVQVTFTQGLPL